MKILYLIFFTVIATFPLLAQNNIGLKYFGLSIHPNGEIDNAFLMPNKLDKNGYLVINIGGEITYEYFIYQDIVSIKVIQALYADCAVRLGGFSHLGIRGRIFKFGKHSLSGGIGPTLVYRRNWLEFEGYINQNRFSGDLDHKFQSLFLWYGGEFEYKYDFSQNFGFTVSFVPGYPDLMSLSLGVNYNFNKK